MWGKCFQEVFAVQIPGRATGYMKITQKSILEAGLNSNFLIVIPARLLLKIQNETPVPDEGTARILWELLVFHLASVSMQVNLNRSYMPRSSPVVAGIHLRETNQPRYYTLEKGE